ncbi:MAG: alpha-galactosidase [Anaerolineae bacterium]|nr:alpha-galactosidase [Anaerolineae bacterium]
MPKITIIGAGGYVFPLTLIRDVLSFPALRGAHFSLMDIAHDNLARTFGHAERLITQHNLPASVEATTDLRKSLDGADFVVVTFQVGGIEAYAHDVEIPRKYGLDQTVGDTLGPGGIFRGLRTAAALDPIIDLMKQVCPDALMIQYANPMGINCWYTSEAGINTVGLCHSVQGTSQMLADHMGLDSGSWTFKCAGINHQAWFIEFKHKGVDVMPLLRKTMNDLAAAARAARASGNASDELYGGGGEQVRTAIMNLTGYFQTESSHHASEYLPYFRRTAAEAQQWLPERWDYYEICRNHDFVGLERRAAELAEQPLTPSHEYGAYIIDSMTTNTPRVVYGNVPNHGIITNLMPGCSVEVPCLVDAQGIQPTVIGELPPACAGVNAGSVAVQNCAVKAAQSHDRSLVHAAVALDKYTSAVLTLDEITSMVDELFEAEAAWLPQFAQ